jgi:hypothetical protein
MKKLIVLPVVLILVTGLCFAQMEQTAPVPEIEKLDLEISVGFPIHWTNTVHDQDFFWFNPDYDMEDKSVTANTAIGFSMLFNFSQKVGFSLDTDFFYGAKIAGFANPSSDYISMFGTNIFLGPVFYLYNGIFLRIPLTVGAHMYYFSDDLWMPNFAGFDPANPPASIPNTDGLWMNRRDFQLGPGVSLGVQFHFNKSIYIFSRTNVAIDVFRWHQVKYIADDGSGAGTFEAKSSSDTEFTVNWQVKPVLGIGIKF